MIILQVTLLPNAVHKENVDVSHKYIQHTMFDTGDCYWPQHCGHKKWGDCTTGRIEQVEREQHTKTKPEKRRNGRDLFTAYLAAANRVPTKTYPAAVDRPNCMNASRVNK